MILIEDDVMVPMRDGVRLATDIYRPAEGPSPVLLVRTPYGKRRMLDPSIGQLDVLRAVREGYAVVAQDVRGRLASQGVFEPNVNEASDGVDAIAWASEQPWSSGAVGTFGGSYMGLTQWLAAGQSPPALRAMAPAITFDDAYSGCSHQGGAKVLHDLAWVVGEIAPAELRRRGVSEPPRVKLREAMNELPLFSNETLREAAPFYVDWLTNDRPGEYWEQRSPSSGYERITVPALNYTGWYDIFTGPTLRNFQAMRRRGGSEISREHQRLIVGPWTHTQFDGSFPDREFGPRSSAAALDLTGTQLRWFDRWLRGVGTVAERDPPVLIFVMGIDRWRTESDWPLPDTRYQPYYLHSGGSANSLRGDGALTTEPPERDEPPDVYVADPLHPVPTAGGQVLWPGARGMGPVDQREVETRDDVLVYSTPILEQPVEVTGPIELRLWVTSSAPDTDFTGKLADVHPDGRAIILTDGILRARFRNSPSQPELLEPDTPYEVSIDLWATSNVFLPGHRIRLEVASSNFPKFDRNSNSGGDLTRETADDYRPATNRILHDISHPSRLILPIIQR